MSFRFWLSALALAAAVWVIPSTSYGAQTGKTCHDFQYQEEAQEYWDAGNGRPTADYFGLDGNNDGIACNALPRKPAADNTLRTFLGPTAIIAVAAGAGFWWTRRRDAAARTAQAVAVSVAENAPTLIGTQPADSLISWTDHSQIPPINITISNTSSSTSAARAKSSAKTPEDE